MKGRTIQEIAKELHTIRENSRDLIAHPQNVVMRKDATFLVQNGREKLSLEASGWAHRQIATFNDIPWEYYDRMRSTHPDLLAENVNTWMTNQEGDKRRMLRTVSGRMRAFLSNSYARRDGYDLMQILYPVIQQNKMQVIEAELTETKLYIKATHPNMRGAVKVGDEVVGGVIISTSDVGSGMLRIEPYSVRLLCTNGMVSQAAIKQRHLGRKQTEENFIEILSDEAVEADDKAFFLKARDVLIDSLKKESFEKQIDRFREASERKITKINYVEVVELAAKKVGITSKGMKEDIVKQLLTGNEGAGLTQWGLANSFTALAKSEKVDYDTGIELERAGGEIVALSAADWKSLATA